MSHKVTIKPFFSGDLNKDLVHIQVIINDEPKGIYTLNARAGESINVYVPNWDDVVNEINNTEVVRPIKDITWKTKR